MTTSIIIINDLCLMICVLSVHQQRILTGTRITNHVLFVDDIVATVLVYVEVRKLRLVIPETYQFSYSVISGCKVLKITLLILQIRTCNRLFSSKNVEHNFNFNQQIKIPMNQARQTQTLVFVANRQLQPTTTIILYIKAYLHRTLL